MWVKLLCVLAVSDALRIHEGEKNDQENSGAEKSADQEGSASVLLTRGAGSAEPQHTFGVKIEHPFGKDLQGRVLEQREHHQFGKQPSVDETSVQIEFHPSPTIPASVEGPWKGIDRFREHRDQQIPGQDLSQHQLLGQVLQGLGQVNQILGKNHQGIEQVNQIFGQHHQDYQKHNSFTNGDRELYATGEKKIEEHKNLVDTIKEVTFEKTVGDVNNNLIENKDVTNYNNLRSGFKPIEELNFSNLPKPSEKIEVNNEGVKTITVTKEVPVPYTVEVEKKVPFKVEVPVDRPYPVERPKPYPVYLEKKVPYKVKEYVPQPYTVYKRVPYTVKVHVNKPYPIHVPKPYRVLVEKKVPYQVEKHVPYPVRVYVDKPYPIHVPVLRTVPYTVEKKVPLPVQVSVDRPYPVPVPKPYKVYVEKKVPYSAHEPVYRQPEVEGSGQPVSFPEDQGATQELWSHHRHPEWREYVPYPAQGANYHSHELEQQKVEGSRQGSGTTDQGTTQELQSHHRHPESREYVPYPSQGANYHSHELGQQDDGSRQSGNTDQGVNIETPRPQYHSQWREHVPYPVKVPMYHPHELGQQEVEGSRQPGSTDQGAIQKHQQHPQWKGYLPYPAHVPMYHPHELGQQEVQGSGHPSGTADQRYPQWRERVPYPAHMPTYYQHELSQQVIGESGLPVTADQRAVLETQRHHPSQWREHAPRYS